MPSWDAPPGPQGPPGPPSGPFPGPGPTPFPPPPPAGGGGTSSTTLVLVALAVIALIGGLFLVVNGGDDDDNDSTSAGQLTPEDEGGDGGDPDNGLGGLPDDPPEDDVPDETEPPDTEPPTTEPPAEPDAAVNDCIAVDEAGNFLGTGSCSDGGTTYEVIEIVDGYTGSCTNPDQGSTVYGDYRYCVQLHLVETYCYVFPHAPDGPVDGWITVADGCELPGTVHVIDIVPDVDSGDYCTTDYEWNRWYSFSQPTMTVCVMEY